MFRTLLRLFNRSGFPLNKIEVSKKALISNYEYFSSLNPQVKIAPVLKSNAYGHGLKEVSKIVDELNPPFICVDSLYEAFLLRKAGVKSEILIMGYIDPRSVKRKEMDFAYCVFDSEQVKVIHDHQQNPKIHIFVDTGMHREGILVEDLANFLEQIKEYEQVVIEGVMSHFALTDNVKNPLFKQQVANFKKAIKILNEHSIFPKWVHIGASGAIINKEAFKIVSQTSNLIRVGKSSYGLSPHIFDENLKPALKFTTKIVQIKKIKKGDRVGYDGTFIAEKEMTLGVLPLGYNDGLDRRLSSKGIVLIDGVECPIIGRISMNITSVDISNVKSPEIGQEVIVYSNNPLDKNSLENSAKIAGTIPYELMVHLHPSTKRVVV